MKKTILALVVFSLLGGAWPQGMLAAVLLPGYIYPFAGAGAWAGDNGAATLSSLNGPVGVFAATNGDVYIADTRNNVIRRISGGIITTVAGDGNAGWSGDGGNALAAELNGPKGVCLDPSGNIYIADTGNDLVRKVSTDGTITTVAGIVGETYTSGSDRTGTYGATSVPLKGAAWVGSDSSGNIYVNGTDVIVGTNLRVLASEYLGGAYDAIGPDGSLYLYYNDVIFKMVSPLGASYTTVIAGTTGNGGYTGDGGAATSAKIVVDGMTVDTSGNVLLTENYFDSSTTPWTTSQIVRRVSGGTISTIAGHTADYAPNYSGEGGLATSAVLGSVAGLSVSGSNIFVCDGNCLRSFTVGGTITTAAGERYSGDGGDAVKAGLNSPEELACDASGNVYIADGRNNVIRKVDKGGTISTFAGNGTQGFMGDGASPLAMEFQRIEGLAFNGAGDLYVADGPRIRVITAAGMVTTVAGTGLYGHIGDGAAASLAEIEPNYGSMGFDGAGNLYFCEEGDAVIREITSAGMITTVAGTGSGGFSGDGGPALEAELGPANGVAVAPDGDLFIADGPNNRIRKVDHADGSITTCAGSGSWGYAGDGLVATSGGVKVGNIVSVALDGRGNVYFGDGSFGTVRKVGPDGIISTFAGSGVPGDLGDGGPAAQAQISIPTTLAVDASGNLLIDDFGANRIRKVMATSASINLPSDSVTACHVYHAVLRYGDSTEMEAVGNFPSAGPAAVTVFSPVGKTVRTLFSQSVTAGQAVVESWDGNDDNGEAVASGTYAIRFTWQGGVAVKRVVVIR